MSFIREFLSAVAALFFAAALAFRVVDPHADFGTGLFPVVVRDTRAEKMRLFSAFDTERPVEAVILGSSRSMKLSPQFLTAGTHRRFFNFAVDNARAEDYLAISRWIRSRGAAPRLLVIGLDVEALHDNDVRDDGLAKNRDLLHALTGRPEILTAFWTQKRAFTPPYVEDSLAAVRLRLHPSRRGRFFFEPDGYLRDLEIEEQRARETFNLSDRIQTCLDVYARRFQDMTRLSVRRIGDLNQTIAEARAGGGDVIVWLTPLHPTTVRYLEERTRYGELHAQTLAYLDELRRFQHAVTFDFSEPGQYGGTAAGWDDCAHTSDGDSRLIAARIAAGVH